MGSQRSPAVVVLLTVLTLGVFGFVWLYKFNQEVDEAGQFRFRPGKRLAQMLALFLLVVTIPVALILFYHFLYRAAKNLQVLERRLKITPELKVGPAFSVTFLPIVGFWVYQGMLQAAGNRVWLRVPAGMAVLPQAPPKKAAPKPDAPPPGSGGAWQVATPPPAAAPSAAAPAKAGPGWAKQEQLECPQCGNRILVAVTPGVQSVVNCSKCGFSAPYG